MLIPLLATVCGCGPAVKQYIQVTDCNTNQPIAGAVVRQHEGSQGVASTGYAPKGGNTNAEGLTWGKFPLNDSSWVTVQAQGYAEAKVDVPPSPQGAIKVCATPTGK